MSLGPLAENLARITGQYGPPSPCVTACPACGAKIEFWQPDPGEEVTVDCANCRHALRMIGAPSLRDRHGMILERMTGSGGSGRGQASFRSLLTPLAAYRLVIGSWRLQDGSQEVTALRF